MKDRIARPAKVVLLAEMVAHTRPATSWEGALARDILADREMAPPPVMPLPARRSTRAARWVGPLPGQVKPAVESVNAEPWTAGG